ncbi:MAG: hypothetical protein A2Y81_00635 [Nitrospirae bacterium RBG_13_43_8]|nr:MAG: hypothetical protein A2Y81_00635 [Nitrospirae bacterium RBG_13_43_8]
MPKTDNDIALEWRNAIEKKLREEKDNEIIIPYSQVSLAFPGGPHPNSFDIQLIDSKSLQSWAKKLGWSVQTAPEVTHPTQKNTPWIHFIRIT